MRPTSPPRAPPSPWEAQLRARQVRFPAPVPVDSRVRLVPTIRSVESIGAGAVQIAFDAVVEIEGVDKPACVAQPVFRFYR